MAKINIASNVAIIKSSHTLEDLARVAEYRPDALALRDENGDEVFRIGVGGNSVSKYGIEFSQAATDGKAVANVGFPDEIPGEERKAYVMKHLGKVLLQLNQIEEQLPAVAEEIRKEIEGLEDLIEVVV